MICAIDHRKVLRPTKRGILIAAFMFAATAHDAIARDPSRSRFWSHLENGAFRVGMSVIDETDASRPALTTGPAPAKPGRPMQIIVWYPAERGGKNAATLKQYVELSAGKLGADDATVERRARAVDEFIAPRISSGAARQLVESVLATPMRAVVDAPRVRSRFPLVVFLHSSPWGASVMSEFLASHGFVVASIESKGPREAAYKLSRENLDAMVADAAFTVARMRRESNVGKEMGVIGMSNGSIAALALQLTGLVPDAVVSLDGGIGERTGGVFLGERSGGLPRRFTVPLLHLYSPDNPHLDFQYLRSYENSSRTFVRLGRLRHGDFLTDGALERVLPGALGQAPAEASAGFDAACRLTKDFLRANLSGLGKAAREFDAAPGSAGFPASLLTVERLPTITARNQELSAPPSGERLVAKKNGTLGAVRIAPTGG